MSGDVDETGKNVGVIVAAHTIDRMFQRGLCNPAAQRKDAANLAFRDVQDALREGRMTKNEPRWMRGPYRRGKLEWSKRYVWSACQARVYIIGPARTRTRKPEFAETWMVLTVLSTRDDTGAPVRLYE